jgi:hypothetical protein
MSTGSFVTKNKDQSLFNSQVHKINTRQTCNLHLPSAVKDLSGDNNKFKLALKRYLLHNSFCSLEEHFNA